MGSKTPEGHQQEPDNKTNADKPIDNVTSFQTSSAFAHDDLGGSDEGDDDDDDLAVADIGLTNDGAEADKKKKKRKRSKKKKKNALPKQSSPHRVLLSTLYPSGEYPVGELMPYDNLKRVTGEEIRANERMDDAFLSDYRQAAEIHRKVRKLAREIIKPGVGLIEVADEIDNGVRALVGHQGLETGDSLKGGLGFPTGLCLNNGTAHYTPNPGHKDVVLKYEDVLKVDFGVHVNGRIVDSAFTVAFDPVYDNLLTSVKEATQTGVKAAGIDARISEIGAAIQEVMESYEVEIKGKTYPVKAVRNITGHNIEQYRIHGGKIVPFIKNSSRQIMEEGEVFAIETFGTTGRGYMLDDVGVYGYGRDPKVSAAHIYHPGAKALLKTIDENFKTIVFCRRYLERLGVKNYLPAMNILISNGIIQEYGPLRDIKGSYTAQFEHTILLHGSGKEIISRGEDY